MAVAAPVMLVTTCMLVAVSAVAACTSSPADYDGAHTTACSTGAAWSDVPPAVGAAEYQNVPQCVPRCGFDQTYPLATGGSARLFTRDALPSGTCENENEHCGLTAGNADKARTQVCDLSTYECICAQSSWRCYTTSKGTGTCAPR